MKLTKKNIYKFSKNNLLIVSFCNLQYSKVALNWCSFLSKNNIKNYLIISTDNACFDFLKKNNINTILDKRWNCDTSSWNVRLSIIYEIIKEGFDIIHSDLDAIWRGDPTRLLEEKCDFVFSTGTFPERISKSVGFSVCMGWFYVKSNDKTKEVFEEIFSKKGWSDDQQAFNEFLFGNYNKNNKIVFNEYGVAYYSYKELNIKILNEKIIYRKNPNDTAIVCHPLCRWYEDIFKILKSHNLWGDN